MELYVSKTCRQCVYFDVEVTPSRRLLYHCTFHFSEISDFGDPYNSYCSAFQRNKGTILKDPKS